MKPLQFLLVLLVGAASFAAGGLWERKSLQVAPLESRIMRAADARKATGPWGSIATYTAEGTPTAGTSSMLVAELEFLPGKQL